MTVKRPFIVMAGAFPPPILGMAMVNAAVCEQLKHAGVDPMIIDLAAESLDRSLPTRLRRLPKVLSGIRRILLSRERKAKILYISISGGLGQGFEILILLFARLRGMRIFLHHHSFSYLDQHSRLTEFLSIVAGHSATHITLCPTMAARMRKMYTMVKRIAVVSNSVFMFKGAYKSFKSRSQLQTVGFFGNISKAKGIFDFLNLIQAIVEEKLTIQAKIAGPFQDVETELEVRRRLSQQSQIEYVGPKYGLEKDVFLSNIDILVFPTHYDNEAEPLTIHEAMNHGLPVIAYGRGCIPEIVDLKSGKVIDPLEPFVPAALEQIKEWITFPQLFETVSRTASKCFSETISRAIQQREKLLAEILCDKLG